MNTRFQFSVLGRLAARLFSLFQSVFSSTLINSHLITTTSHIISVSHKLTISTTSSLLCSHSLIKALFTLYPSTCVHHASNCRSKHLSNMGCALRKAGSNGIDWLVFSTPSNYAECCERKVGWQPAIAAADHHD